MAKFADRECNFYIFLRRKIAELEMAPFYVAVKARENQGTAEYQEDTSDTQRHVRWRSCDFRAREEQRRPDARKAAAAD